MTSQDQGAFRWKLERWRADSSNIGDFLSSFFIDSGASSRPTWRTSTRINRLLLSSTASSTRPRRRRLNLDAGEVQWCMCLCVCVYVCVCLYIYIYIHIYIRYIIIYTIIYIYNLHIYIYNYNHNIYICTCLCVYVCVCVCVCVYVRVYKHNGFANGLRVIDKKLLCTKTCSFTKYYTNLRRYMHWQISNCRGVFSIFLLLKFVLP